MHFSYRRSYNAPLEAVLLDWAGTTMDFGCMAPARVFVEVFKRKNVPITVEEARAPMGRAQARAHSAHRRARLGARALAANPWPATERRRRERDVCRVC